MYRTNPVFLQKFQLNKSSNIMTKDLFDTIYGILKRHTKTKTLKYYTIWLSHRKQMNDFFFLTLYLYLILFSPICPSTFLKTSNIRVEFSDKVWLSQFANRGNITLMMAPRGREKAYFGEGRRGWIGDPWLLFSCRYIIEEQTNENVEKSF